MKRAFGSMARLFLFLFLFLALGCTRPAEERTRRDLDVGRGRSTAYDVEVASGLAAVRGLSSDRLALWLSAPSVDLSLVVRETLRLELHVENALAGVELGDLDTGSVVPLASGDGKTKKSWLLALTKGSWHFRLAAPGTATNGRFRFALMSDVQEAIDRVQDIFRLINAQPELDFLLGAGDLTEEGEEDELALFQHELATLNVPYYTTLGNHELGERPPAYQAWFGRANFQFVHRGVYFTLLDSASATIDPLAGEWLDTWLANGRGSVHVVAMHIPPLDPVGTRNAAFASRAEAAALLAKLAEARVDLTLYGHVHSYYSFGNAGIPAFISGGGGATPEGADKVGRHFMVFELDAMRGILSSQVVPVDQGH
ncbi:MAG TPA: metallophosphoesterase [Polyangiaceae bacterium]|nr:metallophosphoesterase [Polyangiaceae bacterium]